MVGRVVCRGTVKKPPQNAPKQTHSTKVKPSCELPRGRGPPSSSLFPRPPSPRLTPPGTFSDQRPPPNPTFTLIMVRTRDVDRGIARRTARASPSPRPQIARPREILHDRRHQVFRAGGPSPASPPRVFTRVAIDTRRPFGSCDSPDHPHPCSRDRPPPSASSPPPPPSSTRTSTSAAWWTSRPRRSPSTASRSVPSCSASSSSS